MCTRIKEKHWQRQQRANDNIYAKCICILYTSIQCERLHNLTCTAFTYTYTHWFYSYTYINLNIVVSITPSRIRLKSIFILFYVPLCFSLPSLHSLNRPVLCPYVLMIQYWWHTVFSCSPIRIHLCS